MPLKSPKRFAIACDLGTTTIAASLVDIDSNRRVSMVGAPNPQVSFGADVVSRLHAAHRFHEALVEMQRLVRDTMEGLFAELAAKTCGSPIERIAIAGNPAMEHILMGLPVERLCFPPFRPSFSSALLGPASSLGFASFADVPVHVFPLPGGFVGGDLVAFLYGSSFASDHEHHTLLFMDIGTNGEIALLHGGKFYATSAAAGPAFEGGNISCGMAAGPGAITRISLVDGKLIFSTYDKTNPKGLAGSAVIDAVAVLLASGLITSEGELLSPSEVPIALGNRVIDADGSRKIILYRDASSVVTLSQDDIRQVQLAKAAIAAGTDVLLDRARIRRDDLQEVIVTGSFGVEIESLSLKRIGIFTEKMVKKARFLREGALTGVERMLTAPDGISAVEELSRSIDVVPLSGTPAFEKNFLQQLNFP